MNQKAQIATGIAVLLGIFLVVITAIKFDWVGTVVRGEKIIKFGHEEVEKKEETQMKEEQTQEPETPIKEEKDGIVVSCYQETSNNNVFMAYTSQGEFENDTLVLSTFSINANYTIDAGKATFDTLMNNYNDLSTKYKNIQGIKTGIVPGEKKFEYIQQIAYDTVDETVLKSKGLPELNPRKDVTLSEFEDSYKAQGYTCTQH